MENKYATITIRVSEQEKKALKVIAAQKDSTTSEIIRELIQQYLKEEK